MRGAEMELPAIGAGGALHEAPTLVAKASPPPSATLTPAPAPRTPAPPLTVSPSDISPSLVPSCPAPGSTPASAAVATTGGTAAKPASVTPTGVGTTIAAVKSATAVKPTVAAKPSADPFAGVVQRPSNITGRGPYQAAPDPKAAIRDARLDVEQVQRLHEELKAKASQAWEEAKRVRPTVQALERKGQKPTQQQTETLARHAELAKARDEVEARLKVAQEKLRALQPPEGARKHGQAGLAQEAKYRRAAGPWPSVDGAEHAGDRRRHCGNPRKSTP